MLAKRFDTIGGTKRKRRDERAGILVVVSSAPPSLHKKLRGFPREFIIRRRENNASCFSLFFLGGFYLLCQLTLFPSSFLSISLLPQFPASIHISYCYMLVDGIRKIAALQSMGEWGYVDQEL